MAAIGDERRGRPWSGAAAPAPGNARPPPPPRPPPGWPPSPNGTTSIGKRKPSQHGHPFRFIGDDHHAGAGAGHDLLPQQRAAAALDQAEIGGDLVGAVHRQIERRRLLQGGQRHAQALGVPARRLGGRHRHDAQAGAHPLGQKLDEMPRGRAGAEPEPHAGLDEFEGARRGGTLLAFDVHRGCGCRGRGWGWPYLAMIGGSRIGPRQVRRVRTRRHACSRTSKMLYRSRIMAPPTVVFDLDGTLVDTAPDLIATLNTILGREGLPPIALRGRPQHGGRRRPAHAGAGAGGGPAPPGQRRSGGGRPIWSGCAASSSRITPTISRITRGRFPGVEAALDDARRARLPAGGVHQQARMAVAAAARRARAHAPVCRHLRRRHLRGAKAGCRNPARDGCAGGRPLGCRHYGRGRRHRHRGGPRRRHRRSSRSISATAKPRSPNLRPDRIVSSFAQPAGGGLRPAGGPKR